MPLIQSTLASDLERILTDKPSPSAASDWAQAYLAYASPALSAAGSLATNAQGNLGILLGAFGAAFAAQVPPAAAAAIAGGVQAYWQAIAWVGPVAAGATTVPGNFGLAGALGAIFADLSERGVKQAASDLASAFHAGASTVITTEVPFVQPAPPIVGPVS